MGPLQEQELFLTTEPAPALSLYLSMLPFPHTPSVFSRRNTGRGSLPLLLNPPPHIQSFLLRTYDPGPGAGDQIVSRFKPAF